MVQNKYKTPQQENIMTYRRVPPRPKRILTDHDEDSKEIYVDCPFLALDSYFLASRLRTLIVPTRRRKETSVCDTTHEPFDLSDAISPLPSSVYTHTNTPTSKPQHQIPPSLSFDQTQSKYPMRMISTQDTMNRPITPSILLEQDPVQDPIQPPLLIRSLERPISTDRMIQLLPLYTLQDEDYDLHGLGFLNEDLELSDDDDDDEEE